MNTRRIVKLVLIGVMLALGFSCLAFLFVNVNRPILQSSNIHTLIESENVHKEETQIVGELHKAPWQGLRYVSKVNEWRFYAVAGESRKIDLVGLFDLVKVYYLKADGGLAFTWAATGLSIPGQEYSSTASAPIQSGDLIEVVLIGKHVNSNGVQWDLCESEYCRLASMIDTILILDDKGTGITNGFIRYGWEPPTWPEYGFLCWNIRPVSKETAARIGQ